MGHKRVFPVASHLAVLVDGASPSQAQSAVWTVATLGFNLGFSTPEEHPPLPWEGQRLKCWCPVALGRTLEPSPVNYSSTRSFHREAEDVAVIFPLTWPVV